MNIAYVTFSSVDQNGTSATVGFQFTALAPDGTLVPTVGATLGGGGTLALNYGDSGEDVKGGILTYLRASNVYDDPALKIRFIGA